MLKNEKHNETHNEKKLVVTERFIKTLRNKTCKQMTLISKNVHIERLYDIVNKCNNTYQKTIKMKPVDIRSNTFINSTK